MQSREPDAFDDESMATFQLMSDQLTVAIQNTRLFEESQKNFEKLRSTSGLIDRQAWDQMIQTTRLTGFEYDGLEARPIYKSLSPGKGEKNLNISRTKNLCVYPLILVVSRSVS